MSIVECCYTKQLDVIRFHRISSTLDSEYSYICIYFFEPQLVCECVIINELDSILHIVYTMHTRMSTLASIPWNLNAIGPAHAVSSVQKKLPPKLKKARQRKWKQHIKSQKFWWMKNMSIRYYYFNKSVMMLSVIHSSTHIEHATLILYDVIFLLSFSTHATERIIQRYRNLITQVVHPMKRKKPNQKL